eukprot:79551-Rhodomonas_salina.1
MMCLLQPAHQRVPDGGHQDRCEGEINDGHLPAVREHPLPHLLRGRDQVHVHLRVRALVPAEAALGGPRVDGAAAWLLHMGSEVQGQGGGRAPRAVPARAGLGAGPGALQDAVALGAPQ